MPLQYHMIYQHLDLGGLTSQMRWGFFSFFPHPSLTFFYNFQFFFQGEINNHDRIQNNVRALTFVAFGVILILWEVFPTFMIIWFFRVRRPQLSASVVRKTINNVIILRPLPLLLNKIGVLVLLQLQHCSCEFFSCRDLALLQIQIVLIKGRISLMIQDVMIQMKTSIPLSTIKGNFHW